MMLLSVLQATAIHQRTAQQKAGHGAGKLPFIFTASALPLRHSCALQHLLPRCS